MRDRLYIEKSYRTSIIDPLEDKDILGFKTTSGIDKFVIAVALGLDNPCQIKSAKDGYVQLHNSVQIRDKALFTSILLGLPENQKEIDKYANISINYDEAEQCAESGFLILKDLVEDANWDEELLEKELIQKLRLLYQKNVKSNL